MLYLGILFAFIIFTFTVFVFYRKWHEKWPPNSDPNIECHPRTLEEKALAVAFAKLYEMRADTTFSNFVTAADRDRLYSLIAKYLRENTSPNLATNNSAYQSTFDIDRIVEKAVAVFLQI